MEKTNDLQTKLFVDRSVRTEVTKSSHQWFFSTYFADYIKSPTANLHRQLFGITENADMSLAVVVAFRGSAKSTIMTMSYPIWAVIGVQQKKFVLIVSQTQYQAKVHLQNIKRALENNELLANDHGPFVESTDEWGSTSIFIPKYGARITAISSEQSVRGVRHGAHRPDLIIADDVEDMSSVKTREGRNKTFDWFTGEIIPAGDTSTKIIVIGNLLHEDSLLMRFRERIENNEIDGTFYEFPIVRNDKSLWPGKYPDKKSLSSLSRSIGNKIAWEREYMLRIIPDEDQVIFPEWIKYYDNLPDKTKENEYINSFISVDLAISQKSTADYTAIITIHLFGYKPEDRCYYIDVRFVNKRITHLETLTTIELIYADLAAEHLANPIVLVEQVAYQRAVVEQLESRGIKAKGVKVHLDKRARLQLVSSVFQQGQVYIANDRKSAVIAQQLTGFGVEKYDDLADAVSMGLGYIQTSVKWAPNAGLSFIGGERYLSYGIKYVD